MLSEEEVCDLVDKRIQAGLAVHTKRIVGYAKEYTHEVLEEELGSVKEELKESAAQIFGDMVFVGRFKKYVDKLVGDTVSRHLCDEGLKEHVRVVTAGVTKDVFKGIIESVVEVVVRGMNKRLKCELEVSKKLCYSIDAEIRHTLMCHPTSPSLDLLVKKRIGEAVSKVTEGLLDGVVPKQIGGGL